VGSWSPVVSVVQPVEVPAGTPASPLAKASLTYFPRTESKPCLRLKSRVSLISPKVVYSQILVQVPMRLDPMSPKLVFSQEHMPNSTHLTLMSPRSILYQEPVPTSAKLSIMAPVPTHSQVPVDSPLFLFALSIFLPLFVVTSQALTLTLQHVGENVSEELMYEMVKGWLIGALSRIMLHACCRGLTRLPGNVLYLGAW
jgi:hypothetical protein